MRFELAQICFYKIKLRIFWTKRANKRGGFKKMETETRFKILIRKTQLNILGRIMR